MFVELYDLKGASGPTGVPKQERCSESDAVICLQPFRIGRSGLRGNIGT